MNNPHVDISPSAAQHIAAMLQGNHAAFRVLVEGGGCSGFQYKFSVDDKAPDAAHDLIFTSGDARVVVDDMSIQFLNGAQIDYVETLGHSGFEIKNPNATSGCGCGTSFSVT